ncbi:hypothetical protein ACOMHN_059333 [Nucella lapillus]
MPLYGTLDCGESELVTFTFFGHANILGEVKAMCEVEGGPNYKLTVSGEASLVDYHFEVTELDFGKQLYDTVGVKELTLVNTGRVPFSYYALDVQPVNLELRKPGMPGLVPHSGTMDPFCEQKLQVRFLPGVPGPFSKHFSVQVAHFEPDVIHIYGEGVFPRMSLDLPRCASEDPTYRSLLVEACKNLMVGSSQTTLHIFTTSCLQDPPKIPAQPAATAASASDAAQSRDYQLLETTPLPTSLEVQLEVERLAIRNFALEKMASDLKTATQPEGAEKLTTSADTFMGCCQSPGLLLTSAVVSLEKGKEAAQPRVKKVKPKLPRYLLDFGYVVPGTQCTHFIRATNTGWCPVSFRVRRGALGTCGFGVGLDKVHRLPGAPEHEAVDFEVTFDPKAARLPIGPVEVTVPIDIVQGPIVELCLRAHVTVPSMQLSHDSLDFGEVKCGECRIVMVQIHNHHHVPGVWTTTVGGLSNTSTEVPSERCPPLHRRRKSKTGKKNVPVSNFEVFPASGVLLPSQRMNVQIKFFPTEQKLHKETLYFQVAQSSQQLAIACRGEGLEPSLDLSTLLLQFAPILPFSQGDTQTVMVTNPCSFPVEFYCLELDTQYLEEEKVLRTIPGYSDLNFLLLPLRNPGDKLPTDLLEYYKECKRRQEEEEEAFGQMSLPSFDTIKGDEQEKCKVTEVLDPSSPMSNPTCPTPQLELPKHLTTEAAPMNAREPDETRDQAANEPVQEPMTPVSGVGQALETSPVLEAVASYLGMDLSEQARAASHRCGVAVIIHGSPQSGRHTHTQPQVWGGHHHPRQSTVSPLSGKSVTAMTLAQHYDAVVVTLDGVVMEAITKGTSHSAAGARDLCREAGRLYAEELRMQEDHFQMEGFCMDTASALDHQTPGKAKSGNAWL